MKMQIALITVMLLAVVTCHDQDDQDNGHYHENYIQYYYDQDKVQQRYNKVSGCKSNCHSRRSLRCGSNGVTYLNRCYLQNARCDDPSIRMVSRGPCPESEFFRQESNVLLCLNTGMNANSGSDSGEQQQPMFIRCLETSNNGGGNAGTRLIVGGNGGEGNGVGGTGNGVGGNGVGGNGNNGGAENSDGGAGNGDGGAGNGDGGAGNGDGGAGNGDGGAGNGDGGAGNGDGGAGNGDGGAGNGDGGAGNGDGAAGNGDRGTGNGDGGDGDGDGGIGPGGIGGGDTNGAPTPDNANGGINGDTDGGRATAAPGTSQYQLGGNTTPTGKCSETCPANYEPVCGSDDFTYDNECLLEWIRCSRYPNLRKIADGRCPERPNRGDI